MRLNCDLAVSSDKAIVALLRYDLELLSFQCSCPALVLSHSGHGAVDFMLLS